MRAAIPFLLMMALWVERASAQVTLQNDGFESGQTLGAQGGFAPGEIGASRFVAPGPGRRLQSVLLFFGGASGTRTITLHVWDDSAGTTVPGPELFSADFDLIGSDQNLSSIDVGAMNIVVPQQFRIGIEMQNAGVPSLARDVDKSIAQDRNYLFGDLGFGIRWYRSYDAGLRGDWILRAVVSDGGSGTPDAGTGTPDAATGGPDGGTGGPDAGTGGTCNGNAECPLGQFCDTQLHTCTFECRTADDCGGGTCNSLGQCVAADGDGGGCCSTGSATTGGMLGALGLAGAVGLLVTRRRRRA